MIGPGVHYIPDPRVPLSRDNYRKGAVFPQHLLQLEARIAPNRFAWDGAPVAVYIAGVAGLAAAGW